MPFMTSIIDWFWEIVDYFHEAYQTAQSWTWPFNMLQYPMFGLYICFYQIWWHFTEFGDWLIDVNSKVQHILTYSDIAGWFSFWHSAAADAYTWVLNSWTNVGVIVEGWWSSMSLNVQGWIQDARSYAESLVNTVNIALSALQQEWFAFRDRIPSIDMALSWFQSWYANTWGVIDTWWTSTKGEVQGLINSAFLEREPFWAGWQDWRDQVASFFSDPEDWLYKSVDRIIERFW